MIAEGDACFHNIDGQGVFDLHEDGEQKIRKPGIEVCEWEQDEGEPEWEGPK